MRPNVGYPSDITPLMPQGTNLEELQWNRHLVVEIAIKNNVRYSSREHVVLWDTEVGV